MKDDKTREIWALEEKSGKHWVLALWFRPQVHDDRNVVGAEEHTKNTAKTLTDRHHKYRAVRYVRAR